MIRKFTYSVLTASLLFSTPLLAQTKKVKITLSNSIKKEYKAALAHFKNKEYQKAYDGFNALFQDNLDHILINYYLGRSAFETGQYEFAISAYDRILIQQPSNSRVRLELAQSYLQMGLWAQALEEFNTVSKGKLPPNIKQRVERTIALLKNKEKKSQFSAYAMGSIIYDSNINNTSLNTNFDIYSPDLGSNITVSSDGKEESTMIYHTVVNMNYKYKLEEDTVWDTNFSFMNMKYDDYKSKDLHVYSINTKPIYFKRKYKSAIALQVDKIFLGHKPYQLNYYIIPEYTESITENILLTASLKLGRINYQNENDKDAKIFDYGTSFKYLNDNLGLFTFAINSGKEIELSEARTDITNSYANLYLSNSMQFLKNYTLTSSANFKMTNYRDFDTNFQNRREDKKRDFALSIERQMSNNLILNAGTTYTKRDSNQEPSEYSKYTFKLGAFITF